jgi:hypothetical protein
MKIQKKDRRACAAKASALKRLLGRGMPLEGSLNMSMRGGSEHWQLTDKVDGRSRTLYVPARHAAEVTESIELWKRVRQGLKELSAAARDAYANAFAGPRGAERSGRPKGAGAKGGGGRASRAKSSRASKSASTRAGAQASRRRKCRTSRRR